jgi:hypothetical protein
MQPPLDLFPENVPPAGGVLQQGAVILFLVMLVMRERIGIPANPVAETSGGE